MVQMLNDAYIKTVEELKLIIISLKKLKPQSVGTRKERAVWVMERLIRFKYIKLKKTEKGILIQYLKLMTGCSIRTINRHISAYKKGKRMCKKYKRNKFSTIYTNEDKDLLAETDNLHGMINGNATKHILQTEYQSGNKAFKRLSKISCAHIYNLRKSRRYRDKIQIQSKTQSVQRAIGERRKPNPEGHPGFLRVDTVHQGDDLDGTKGLYHINLVDEVTQWQIVVTVKAISEKFLKPVLEEALTSFPFVIKNFHSDNGSEFINKVVHKLLKKLLISQTKSRSRKSNDNALCEGKNGSTIRKHIGHWHIPKKYVPELNSFYKNYFIPYLNYYRPCAFPVRKTLENGKIKILYPLDNYNTPLQKLLSLNNFEQFLTHNISSKSLYALLNSLKSPNAFAKNMQEAKNQFLSLALSK